MTSLQSKSLTERIDRRATRLFNLAAVAGWTCLSTLLQFTYVSFETELIEVFENEPLFPGLAARAISCPLVALLSYVGCRLVAFPPPASHGRHVALAAVSAMTPSLLSLEFLYFGFILQSISDVRVSWTSALNPALFVGAFTWLLAYLCMRGDAPEQAGPGRIRLRDEK